MPEIIRNKDALIDWFYDEHELSTLLGSQRCWLPVILISLVIFRCQFGKYNVDEIRYTFLVKDTDTIKSSL